MFPTMILFSILISTILIRMIILIATFLRENTQIVKNEISTQIQQINKKMKRIRKLNVM